MSSGSDPFILLHDIRHTAKPLYKLTGWFAALIHTLIFAAGHLPNGTSHIKGIYSPIFSQDGLTIMSTAGLLSPKLTVFDVLTGSIISRTELDQNCTKITALQDHSGRMAIGGNRTISILQPL
jgi:hypothetical protein